MDKTQLSDILNHSPSIKLLRMRPKNLEFFLSFVLDTFEEHSVVTSEAIHHRLSHLINEFEDLIDEEGDLPQTLETNEEKYCCPIKVFLPDKIRADTYFRSQPFSVTLILVIKKYNR